MSTNQKHKKYQIPQNVLDEVYEDILAARTLMVMTCPFFGILAAQLKLVPNNTWCSTLAVDGKHLYYNPEYIKGIVDPERRAEFEEKLKTDIDDLTAEQINDALNGLSMQNLVAAMCHEILHCAYNHFLRKGTRDRSKWNKAADYAINQIIKRNPKMGTLRKTWLYHEMFEGMPAEEIYNLLCEMENSGSGGGSGNFPKGGTLDHHDIPQQNENSDDDSDEFPDYTQEELEEFMESFKDAMISAAMAEGAPPEIRAMVQDYKEPKIDWRSKLNRTLRSLIKDDVTYMIPSRRTWSNGIGYGIPIFPGLKPNVDIDICVALDASGSISPTMLRDFLSEVYGITQQFSQFKLRILTFDTRVYEVHDYVNGQEEQILSYPVTGGGGTLFTAVWDFMKKDEYMPKQLVMFTDGEPYGSWGDSDYCETLFVVHSNPKVEAPFGVTVHYELEGKK